MADLADGFAHALAELIALVIPWVVGVLDLQDHRDQPCFRAGRTKFGSGQHYIHATRVGKIRPLRPSLECLGSKSGSGWGGGVLKAAAEPSVHILDIAHLHMSWGGDARDIPERYRALLDERNSRLRAPPHI